MRCNDQLAKINLEAHQVVSGPVVQVVNLQGHPLNGSECDLTLIRSFDKFLTDDANHWVEADGMLTNGEEDLHHFKYELPTDKKLVFQIDNSDSACICNPLRRTRI